MLTLGFVKVTRGYVKLIKKKRSSCMERWKRVAIPLQ
jgi:hypothetical protein